MCPHDGKAEETAAAVAIRTKPRRSIVCRFMSVLPFGEGS
jgi:hypothetical protein